MTTTSQWRTATVVGAGTIGLGWAALFASRGLSVKVTDPREDLAVAVATAIPMLAKSVNTDVAQLLSRIEIAASVDEAVSGTDLIQESGPESLEFKQSLFAELGQKAPAHTVFASSSSAIPASAIAAKLPENVAARLLIAHPFNPPQVVPLVEVVPGNRTSEAVTESVMEGFRRLGKVPVRLHREIQGFVANRLQTAVLKEAIYLVDQGVVSVPELDAVMRSSLGERWAVVGPFEAYHLGGGPGGIRHMIDHLGRGMAQSFKDGLGEPDLDDALFEKLITQTEAEYGATPEDYYRNSELRDARQIAIQQSIKTIQKG